MSLPLPRNIGLVGQLTAWSRYTLECGLFLALLPIGLYNLTVRLNQGRYRGMFWQRFWGGASPKAPFRGVLIISSGIGETRTGLTTAEALANRIFEPVALLSQLSRAIKELPDSPVIQVGYAPFKWPIGALICLLRWRPKELLFVEVPSDPHLAFVAQLMRIRVGIIHVNITETRADDLARRALRRWDFERADWISVQSTKHEVRLRSAGVTLPIYVVTGPMITWTPRSSDEATTITSHWRDILQIGIDVPVIVAGSTYPAEEVELIRAIELLWQDKPNVLLVLAPRRLDRTEGVEAAALSLEVPFDRRSSLTDHPRKSNLVILDTAGELANVYSVARVAHVGGTLMSHVGGHTPLEALAWGVPLTSGPNYDQQETIMEELESRQVLTICDSAQSVALAWRSLLDAPKVELEEFQDQSIPHLARLLKG